MGEICGSPKQKRPHSDTDSSFSSGLVARASISSVPCNQWRDRVFPSETLLLRTDCPTVALREVRLGRLEHPYPPVAPDCHEVVGVSKLDCAGALP